MDADSRFEALYAEHAARVKAYALRRSDPATADDVVSDVFLVAWRRLAEVPEPALPWLYGVARRVLANRRRGESRTAALRERLAGESPRGDHGPRPGDPGVRDGDPRVWLALDALPEADREVLILHAWEELAPAEIATVLGVRPNAISVRLHRARRRFAVALNDHDRTPTDELEARR